MSLCLVYITTVAVINVAFESISQFSKVECVYNCLISSMKTSVVVFIISLFKDVTFKNLGQC